MRPTVLITLLSLVPLVFPQHSYHQRSSLPALRLDMSKLNGMQPDCLDKGRFQDPEYNASAEVDKIVARPKDAVPVLISLLTNTRRVRPDPVCYFPDTRVGDVAFMMLSDLFTDASWEHCTVPGACWDALGPHDSHVSAGTQWQRYLRKHRRSELQAHYRELWEQYKDQVIWDSAQRCFRLSVRKN